MLNGESSKSHEYRDIPLVKVRIQILYTCLKRSKVSNTQMLVGKISKRNAERCILVKVRKVKNTEMHIGESLWGQ